MSKNFYIDNQCNLKIEYENLINDLNQLKSFNTYCYSTDYYSIFRNIILSLLIDEPIYLLDFDFSKEEIKKLTEIDDFEKIANINVSLKKINNFEDVLNRISLVKNWKVFLYTSGTTGLPKKVSHDFPSITRMVKSSLKHSEDIWGFAYNPTHIAGLQVFFQALLNKSTLVRLFGLPNDMIIDSIINYNVTHISATPTFYRLLLPIKEQITSVIRITSGGEKLDLITMQRLKNIFINATILNVYASTEAGTILAADCDIFTLKKENQHLIKIVNQELFIHSSLLGKSDTFNLIDDWYATGDLVDVISESPLRFRFLSRKNEMINVGGYKVNPQEIEQILLSYEHIKDARVYSKKNSVLGSIVCADIVCNDNTITIPEINILLRSKLQEYKVPRIINFVESIKQTRSGKKVRK